MTDEQDIKAEKSRLDSLTVRTDVSPLGRRYTLFVRSMRIVLPLVAVALLAVIITWPDMEKRVAPVKREDILPQSSALQNELLKPHFESTDENGQPFTIDAATATQNRDNPDLIHLDKPMGKMLTAEGEGVTIEADTGLYEQNAEKLLLKGLVKLTHASGYSLESAEMRINMSAREAFSDQDVHVESADGTIDAAGMEAFSQNGLIVFKGPAKMILTSAGDSFSLGKTAP